MGIDWGTSNVRAWTFAPSGELLASAQSQRGMASLSKADYPTTLSQLLDDLHAPSLTAQAPIVACGMIGARQGWKEAPYLDLPANLERLGQNATQIEESGGLPPVHILPGIACHTAGSEDVMRGEETQLLGLLRFYPDFAGWVCLPGTHSKWANVQDGQLLGFSTFMTGELFETLSSHTILRHSMPDPERKTDEEAGISEGLEQGLQHPEDVTRQLFKVRAATLVAGKSSNWARGFLSGLLIGTEIGAIAPELSRQPVPIIGAPSLQRLYAEGLARKGLQSITIDATEATIAGLKAAREQIS
ncbi:MAG: 2-dehydro-3-deoxygalactonokinase [Hyphomicrobiaceae bacterium]|nr:2-dehydro-3-deoxygalactonokinase [Hyphomicrobiaceae bacterium]MCC0023473.1 2-dehydro-3-deoxygalactonokinase [Hyphomicrobiaceae bacterium]